MALPELITSRDLKKSRFGQLVDSAEDISVPATIARAEATVQSKLHRKLKRRSYTEYSTGRGYTLFLRQRPVINVTLVEKIGYNMYTYVPVNMSNMILEVDSGYIVSPVYINGTKYRVTYEAGYDDIPEDIKEAIVIQSALYLMRDLEIYGPGDGRPPGTEYLEKKIDNLLAPHKQSVMV